MGFCALIQGGVSSEDWARQERLRQIHPQVIPCFGLHPYYVAAHSAEACHQELDILAKQISRSVGLGEIGLDFRDSILASSPDLPFEQVRAQQIEFFIAQIEIAELAQKTAVFHIVRAHSEAQQILQHHWRSQVPGVIHSFSGSIGQAKVYLDLGFYLSLSPSILRRDPRALRDLLSSIPEDRLLLESDSRPLGILNVAKKLSEIQQVAWESLLDQSSQNCVVAFPSLPAFLNT
jgi:TatD DNase family protein